MPVDQSNLGLDRSLARLAYNLRWAWHAPTADLFQKLAPEVWDLTRNPVAVANAVSDDRTRLGAHAQQLARLEADLDAYLGRPTSTPSAPRVAYFSAEFAVVSVSPSTQVAWASSPAIT
jgi:glycogen phosphorylase